MLYLVAILQNPSILGILHHSGQGTLGKENTEPNSCQAQWNKAPQDQPRGPLQDALRRHHLGPSYGDKTYRDVHVFTASTTLEALSTRVSLFVYYYFSILFASHSLHQEKGRIFQKVHLRVNPIEKEDYWKRNQRRRLFIFNKKRNIYFYWKERSSYLFCWGLQIKGFEC